MSTPKTKVAVLGTGSWGTAVANVLADAGQEVVLWGRDKNTVDQINRAHENRKYLPGIALNPTLCASEDLKKCLQEAEILVCSIPTQQIRNVFGPNASLIKEKAVVNTSKGIETKTHARVSNIFQEICAGCHYAVLSGPSFALEVVKRLPTAVTVASTDKNLTALVQRLFHTPYFRVYGSTDVTGVELAGALKNIIAISSGIVVGLGLGYNSQAALINRGIVEMVRLGLKQNAQSLTFLGLSGMGDLILTCTGPLSRNRRLGEALGKGLTVEEATPALGGVAEGYYTAKAAYDLMRKYQIDLPIVEQVYKILYQGSTPQNALVELMSRDLRDEWDEELSG